MIKITFDQIVSLHKQLIEITGGSDGIRDPELLDSALMAPFQTFEGDDIHPSIHQKAARLCHSLVNNHPFLDGNKRVGIHAMLTFLEANQITLLYTQEDLIELGLGLAQGRLSLEDVVAWITERDT